MNFIDIDQPNITIAKDKHFKGLFVPLLNYMEKAKAPYNKFFEAHNIPDFLEDILIGKPQTLLNINNNLNIDGYCPELKKEIFKLFNYERFCKIRKDDNLYNAYNLAENLNINTCTYCNRLYTKTVIVTKKAGNIEKITRPQFDHWFSQKDYPLLALSFYNLIPCCSICNSGTKGAKPMNFTDHLHPYITEDVNMKFSYNLTNYNGYKFKVLDNGNKKVKNTIDFFKLQDIYESHLDEIVDIINLKKHYSISYLSNLRSILVDTNISNDELYRLAFGTYLEEVDFEKRPLSRMKRDLLKELRIIK